MGAGPAVATTMTSTTFSAWTAGLTGTPTELDFSPIVIGKSYSTAAGLTLKAIGNASVGFNVTGPDNGGYKLTGFSSTHNFQSLEAGTDSTAVMNVTTPAAGNNGLFLGLATTNNTPDYPYAFRWSVLLVDYDCIFRIVNFSSDYMAYSDDKQRLGCHRGRFLLWRQQSCPGIGDIGRRDDGDVRRGILILFGAVRSKNTRRLM